MTSNEQPRPRDGIRAFAERLYKLAEAEDRGALAALRRSLQDPSGMAAAACPYVVPFLPKEGDRYTERAYFLVAALFAVSGEHATKVTVGDAFREINKKASPNGGDNPSIRGRFVALLDAEPEDIGDHLRHMASLARAKNIALDWEQLLRDLLQLRHPDRFVQRRWAHDFWGRNSNSTETVSSEAEVSP
jgi:CRISPR type I-E-associated protein CasB/Cse2